MTGVGWQIIDGWLNHKDSEVVVGTINDLYETTSERVCGGSTMLQREIKKERERGKKYTTKNNKIISLLSYSVI
jgi:hypothetical protein